MPDQLPPPATAPTTGTAIEKHRKGILKSVKIRWARFKRDRNTGSAPSMLGGSTDASDTHPSGQDSLSQPTKGKEDREEYRRRRDAYYAIPFHQGRQRRRREDGDESFIQLHPKKGTHGKPTDASGPGDPEEDIEDVDEVVVDNSFEVGAPQESLTEPSAGVEQVPNVSMQPGQGKPGMAFGWDPRDKHNGVAQTSSNNQSQHETSSLAYTGQSSFHFQKLSRWFSSLSQLLKGVFFPRFDDDELEKRFKGQEWYAIKMLAFVTSGFLILNWVLACILVPRPFVLFDKVFHYGVAPLLTAPLPIFIILRWPLTRPAFYQFYLTCSLWCWTIWYILSMRLCGFYPGTHSFFTCGSKDFLGMFYFMSGLPALGLFALGQQRFHAAIAASTSIILIGGLVVPARTAMARLLANQICYQFFLLYISWKREMTDRDRFIMSKQIKDAYLYRHRLQMKEKQIQTSKQRLTGYIFHEVRVPLNTAMLAVQNIEASGVIAKPLELEFNALSGSLTVMSKVLNDVLDLNRMDAGKFESVAKPYSFHKVLDSLMVPLRMAAAAKGLQLIEDFDPAIDKYALMAFKTALQAKRANGEAEIEDNELEPWVVGDEMRLRQVFTNLSSNAAKFSQPGGRIEIVTRLLYPCPPGCGQEPPLAPGEYGPDAKVVPNVTVNGHSSPVTPVHSNKDGSNSPPLKPLSIPKPPFRRNTTLKDKKYTIPTLEKRQSLGAIPQTGSPINEKNTPTAPIAVPVDQIVVRIEVRDTGIGIKPQDIRDAKLFSPYVQTEIGRYQGGKGTGLGLALVRRIVKLSGGRLGVKSKFNQGSCFWVELPLGVGSRAIQPSSSDGTNRDVSIRSRPMPVSTIRDFGLPIPDIDDNATERPSQELPNNATMVNIPPPAAHFSHRTIMEHQGLVEMTPSRPERRRESESKDDSPQPSPEHMRSRPGFPPVFVSRLVEQVAKQEAEIPLQSVDNASPPAAIDPTIRISDAPGSRPPSPTKLHQPLTVLVVDDDQLTRKLMTRMLTRLGCVVTTAEHGAMALDMLLGPMYTPSETPTNSALIPSTPGTGGSSQEPTTPRFWDLVLLDNQMPRMSGLEAIARLRAAGRDDLVVGVTGNALIRDQDEYLGAGVDHVLIKPVLERSIKQMLVLAEERRYKSATQEAALSATT